MRIAFLAIILVMTSGCASKFQQKNLTEPTSSLLPEKSIIISTPANGSYNNKEYSGSGKMTALAVQEAFAKFSNATTVSTTCNNLDCLKENESSNFDYYVIPTILHWEDRATEWSGIPDKLSIKLSVYEGIDWAELASTIISGSSKWATMGGDHPQDLLPEPLNAYIESLY